MRLRELFTNFDKAIKEWIEKNRELHDLKVKEYEKTAEHQKLFTAHMKKVDKINSSAEEQTKLLIEIRDILKENSEVDR